MESSLGQLARFGSVSLSTSKRLSWYLALGAIATDFTFSGNLLTNLGSSYISDGGGFLQKVHPGSYMAMLSGAAGAFSKLRCPSARFMDWHLLAFLGGIAFCIAYAFAATGAGNVVVFIDTFLSPGMLAFALQDMDHKRALQLKRIVQCLLVLNACVALCEFASQSHLVALPTEGSSPENEFRPTALYDHALTGAAVTMLGLWLAPQCQGLARWSYIMLLVAALLAFGERTPLAGAIIGLIASLFARYKSAILARDLQAGDAARLIIIALAVICATAAAAYAGTGSRLGEHLYWDSSAQVRLSQFGIINSLDARELLFGCPRAVLLALIEPLRLSSRVAVIENFWLFNIVTLGLFCFPVFVFSFMFLLSSLWGISGLNGKLMIVLFVAVSSCSNSIGRKSTLLVTLVACVVASTASMAIVRSSSVRQAANP